MARWHPSYKYQVFNLGLKWCVRLPSFFCLTKNNKWLSLLTPWPYLFWFHFVQTKGFKVINPGRHICFGFTSSRLKG